MPQCEYFAGKDAAFDHRSQHDQSSEIPSAATKEPEQPAHQLACGNFEMQKGLDTKRMKVSTSRSWSDGFCESSSSYFPRSPSSDNVEDSMQELLAKRMRLQNSTEGRRQVVRRKVQSSLLVDGEHEWVEFATFLSSRKEYNSFLGAECHSL